MEIGQVKIATKGLGRKTKSRLVSIYLLTVLILGCIFGYKLSIRKNLQPWKLLNIYGQLYTLLSVFILSDFIVHKESLKKIIIEVIAPLVFWFNLIFPLGVTITAFAMAFKHETARSVFAFSTSFIGYSSILLLIFDLPVVFPKVEEFKGAESKIRYFGLISVLTGVICQLIAAIMDLN